MVLGILALVLLPVGCCCGFGWLASLPLGIAAIIFGFNARGKVAGSQGTLGGSGKALGGIVMGGTAFAISAVLVLLGWLFFGLSGSGVLNHVFVTPTPSG